MNEDRCRHRFLEFMGTLKQKGYHVVNFHGNINYDFIDVQYEYCDGLEPKALGWIFNTIAVSINDVDDYKVNEGYVQVIHKDNYVALEIVNYQVTLLEVIVANHLHENPDWAGELKEFYMRNTQ